MYCPYCGHPNKEEASICNACGSSLAEEEDFGASPEKTGTWNVLGVTPSLLGRTKELEVLRGAFSESTRTRRVFVVTIVGKVGMGKSRLISEFAEETRAQIPTSRVYLGHCEEGLHAPYQPFAEILRARFSLGDVSEDFESTRRALFAETCELFSEDKGTEIAHLLGYLLGVPSPENTDISVLKTTPERLLIRAQSALKRFWEADAAQSPVILVFEDLHYAPRATIELLSYLASNLGNVPLTFVLTSEPSFFSAYPDWGKGDYLYRRVDLSPLSDEEIKAILQELLAKAPSIPEPLIQIACQRAKGNPFSLVELVWTFLDSGVLKIKDDEWTIDEDRLGNLEIPQTVQEIFEARIRRLSDEERSILSRAALIGQPFWRDALLTLLRADTEKHSHTKPLALHSFGGDEIEAELDTHLESLLQKDLISRAPVSTFSGQIEYRLRHSVIRDILREGISEELQKKYHRLAGQWLEVVSREKRSDHLESIGEHRERAGDLERAAVAYAKAGDLAKKRYTMVAAIACYKRALAILPEDEFAFRLEILHNLGSSLAHGGDNDSAIEVFENMFSCAYTLVNRSKAGVALNKIGRAERDRGNYREANEVLNRALSLFRSVGDTRGVASVLNVIGSVHFRMGNYETALRYVTDSLDLRRSLGDKRSIALSLSDLGSIQQNLSFLEKAARSHQEALEMRRAILDREGTASSLNNLALVIYHQGNIQQAVSYLEEALSIAQEIGHRFGEVTIRSNLGEFLRDLNDLDAAEGHLSAALHMLRSASDLRLETEVRRNLARVLLNRGDLDNAKQHAKHAFELARNLGSKSSMALALRSLGEIASHVPKESEERAKADAEAREFFERTLEICEEMGNEVERARALSVYADFLVDREQTTQAKKILTDAKMLFEKLGMREELRRAKQRLDLFG